MSYVVDPEKFKTILKKRGFRSISHLSRVSGVHRNTIAEYLAQRSSPFQSTFLRVSELLRVDPYELMQNAPSKEGRGIRDILSPICNEFISQNTSLCVIILESRFDEKKGKTILKLGLSNGDVPLGQAEFSIYKVKLDDYLRRKKLVAEAWNLDRSSSQFLVTINDDFEFFAGNEESYRYIAGFVRGLKRATKEALPQSARNEAIGGFQRGYAEVVG
jgi:transcriptional regulator with XRE-family HTH domain